MTLLFQRLSIVTLTSGIQFQSLISIKVKKLNRRKHLKFRLINRLISKGDFFVIPLLTQILSQLKKD